MRRSSIFCFAGISRCRQFEWGRVRANSEGMGEGSISVSHTKKNAELAIEVVLVRYYRGN